MATFNSAVAPQSGGVYYIQSTLFPGYVLDDALPGPVDPPPYARHSVVIYPLNRGYNQQWICDRRPGDPNTSGWDIYCVDFRTGYKYYLSVVDGNSGIKDGAYLQTFAPDQSPEFRTPWGITPVGGTSSAFRIVTTAQPQFDIAAVAQSDRARLRNTLTAGIAADSYSFTFHPVSAS